MGTFLVHSYPATVLFDSGASHSFISSSFAAMGDFPLVPMETPLLIRSPGKELRAEDECRDVLIEIEGLDFLANLILLYASSLDVILGMDWLSHHQGHIDCAGRVVYLTSSSSSRTGGIPGRSSGKTSAKSHTVGISSICGVGFASKAKRRKRRGACILGETPIRSPEELVR